MGKIFGKVRGSDTVVFVLTREGEEELEDPSQLDSKMGIKMLSPPSWVMMMDDGGVVTMGGSPFIVYYPNWGIMSYFTGAQISEYSAKLPGIIEVWDVGSTALGPMV